LCLVIAYLFFKDSYPVSPLSKISSRTSMDYAGAGISKTGSYLNATESLPVPQNQTVPTANVKDRLVIKESNLSLLVSKVVDTQKKILQKTVEVGGYMVSANLSNPQDTATSTITIRIPAKKLESMLEYLRGVSVKVISENLQGEDVTDQYTDLKAQLDTLNKTKMKFEQIMDKAILVEDILNVQREIISLQSQIDSIKGQQLYYEKSAEMAKVTIYLSTDELNLPYAPSDAWRPGVIFKQAVRSLLEALRNLGSAIIWIAVYAVIWLPILLIIIFLRKRRRTSP